MGEGVSRNMDNEVEKPIIKPMYRRRKAIVDMYKNSQLWVEPSSTGDRDYFYMPSRTNTKARVASEQLLVPGNEITILYHIDDGKLFAINDCDPLDYDHVMYKK